MDTIEYNGIRYNRYGKKWSTEKGIIASDMMQDKLNRLYDQQSNYENMSVDDLIDLGDQYKAGGSLSLAAKCFRLAFDKASIQQVRRMLPRYSSLLREIGKSQDAIDLLTKASNKYGSQIITPVLLTSAAAAYCDLKQYGLAKKACDRAFAQGGGQASGELSAVYARIKKESPATIEKQ